MADALRALAALADPIGEVVTGYTMPNGIELRQIRVPLGVVGMIYEARPNVTADAAGLCVKTGNAVILRGGSLAHQSNLTLTRVLAEAAARCRHARRVHPGDRVHRSRGCRGAHGAPRLRRRAHPARRGRADPERGGEGEGPGDRDRHRQLPRLHPRVRRSRDGRAHRRERQDAAAERVQRRGVAAGGRGGLRARSAAGAQGARVARRHAATPTSGRWRSARSLRSSPRPRRTGAPSTTS